MFGVSGSSGLIYTWVNEGFASAGGLITANEPFIALYGYNSGRQLFLNGTLVGTNGSTAKNFTADNHKLGIEFNGGSGFNSPFDGNIAEVIIYNVAPAAIDRSRVESYLALKYGLTLPSNYILSDNSTTVWTTGGGYDNDIAGIGIDNGSGLSQLASRSVNPDSIVTITGTVASMVSGEFLLWGNDDGATTFAGIGTVSGVATANSRLGRIWKAAETGDVGSVTVGFDSASLQTGETYCLLVDNDGNFTNGGTTQVACTVANSLVTFSHDFATGTAPFFILGTVTVVPTAPGGVDSNLQLWLKADAGIAVADGVAI